jgi:hypothetical protein
MRANTELNFPQRLRAVTRQGLALVGRRETIKTDPEIKLDGSLVTAAVAGGSPDDDTAWFRSEEDQDPPEGEQSDEKFIEKVVGITPQTAYYLFAGVALLSAALSCLLYK